MSTLRSRLREYPVVGLVVGAVLCAVAALPYGLDARGMHAHYGLTYPQVCGVYLVAAVLAGTAAAVLAPLARTVIGAYIVGTLVGFIVYGVVALAIVSGESREMQFWIALFGGSVVFGPNAIYGWLKENARGSGPDWLEALRAPTWRLVLMWWLATAIIAPVCWYWGTHLWLGQTRTLIPLLIMLVAIGFAVGLTLGAIHERPASSPDSPA